MATMLMVLKIIGLICLILVGISLVIVLLAIPFALINELFIKRIKKRGGK